jgi:outer membrane protein OmpA-like peptidoglycan-associated protein
MKTLIISIILISAFLSLHAQSIKKADAIFEEMQYARAAELYNEFLTKNPGNRHAVENIAKCYVKLNDTENAERWLSTLCNMGTVDAGFYKMYGDALASNMKYPDAKQWYDRYLSSVADASVKGIVSGLQQPASFFEDSAFCKISLAPFNSNAADFSPMFTDNGLIFCSSRETSKHNRKYEWDNSAYIDLFSVSATSNVAVPLGKPVNTALHEGPASLSVKGDTLFFTRNDNDVPVKGETTIQLKIYYTIKNDGVWGKEKPFELNNKLYSTGHPAVGKNGQLFFVANMPGGFGGTDLYMTFRKNGSWAHPINLGPQVNTAGNEMFPFVDNKGTLYFSSNALPGLGGLDIFKGIQKDGRFIGAENMGFPINSSKDDFGFIIEGNEGYFSSNRNSAKPNDDNIYSFMMSKNRELGIRASSVNEPLNEFSIAIKTSETETSQKVVGGIFRDNFNADSAYRVTVSKSGYKSKTIEVTKEVLAGHKHGEVITVDLERLPKKLAVILESVDKKRIAFGQIEVTNETSSPVIFDSGKEGFVVLEFDPSKSYELTGSRTNFRKTTVTLTPTEFMQLPDSASVAIALSIPPTLFEKNEIGQVIELDIRYDVNKFNIRKDAARELEKLIVYLKKNQTVKVELGSHTDARGSDGPNMKLSQKRAAAAAAFIVSKGISSSRVIPVGYGKNDLKVKAATTEEEHQQNRRTTVKIVGV